MFGNFETALQSVCCLLLQVKATPKHSEECKRLLTLMGVPYIDVSGSLDTSTRITAVQLDTIYPNMLGSRGLQITEMF